VRQQDRETGKDTVLNDARVRASTTSIEEERGSRKTKRKRRGRRSSRNSSRNSSSERNEIHGVEKE
jgi:ribosome assembly protein YihI (activator of Der GTPase)